MKLISVFAAGAAVLLASAAPQAASAETVVPLAKFHSIQLNGGGKVHLRHGPVQRVTILRGDPRISRLAVGARGTERDKLVIDVCRRSCRDDLEVEIVTPLVSGVAVNGGGRIESEGGFPAQANLGVAVSGGGLIDARALPARNVGAAVEGGGRILTRASGTLGAAISGGGEIRYWGKPEVSTVINGGGTVERGS